MSTTKRLLGIYKNSPKMMGVAANHQYDKTMHQEIRNEGEPRLFLKPTAGIVHNPT
jgi:hypothetical protein